MELLGAMGQNVWWLGGYILPFLFILAIVIFFHELGHFLVGRWCGVGVKTFALGFGPELVGYTDRHGTRWKLAAVPLGGYVKFAGDANGASMPDRAAWDAMSEEERRTSFAGKPVWQRAAIVAAGPLANFILAIVIFAVSFMAYGRLVHDPLVSVVEANSPAERAGFRPGDRVVSVDGAPITTFEQLQRIVTGSAEQPLTVVVQRDGADVTMVATPERRTFTTSLGKNRTGVLGLRSGSDPSLARIETFGPVAAVGAAADESWFIVERTFSYIGGLIAGRESPDQLSGPIRIAQVSGEVAPLGIAALLRLAAILSVSIGLINLFPIPLLDGGHLVFYAAEALSGRPLSERTQEIGFRIGFALVLMMMLFATWNDLAHLVSLWRARA